MAPGCPRYLPIQGLEVWAPVSTPVQIITALAAACVATAICCWLQRRAAARHRSALLAAAHGAGRDPLTGLGNRIAFGEAMTIAASGQCPVAVILVNLDGSRPFVSRFGDRAFDQLLVLLAGTVSHLATTTGGTSFRLRRDEFAVIVNGPVTGADDLAARLVATVAEPTEIHLGGNPLTVTASACAGVATLTAHAAVDGRLALVQSDTAMRWAKRVGRGGVAVFEPASLRHRRGVPQPAPADDAEGGATR